MARVGTDPAELIRRWFAEVWNEGRQATIERMVHPDCPIHGLTDDEGATLTGPGGFRVFYERFRSSFSDLHIHVEDAFSQGNKGCARLTFTATHTGPGLGIEPTGRRVRVSGITIAYFNDQDQITDGWNEFDTASLLSQIQMPLSTQVMA